MTMFETESDLGFVPWPHWGTLDNRRQEADDEGEPAVPPPTAEDLEALRQAAYEEGLQAGREEGLQRGADEAQARVQQLVSLIDSLARPLELMDARVEEELVALVIAIVRQLVRREIKTDPGVIVAAIQEALGVLPLTSREVAVKVHPEDAALLREVYPPAEAEAGPGWRIVETPAVSRGGCVVVTSTSEVDATVERRLASAIRHVFGGERTADRRGEKDRSSGDRDEEAEAGSSAISAGAKDR